MKTDNYKFLNITFYLLQLILLTFMLVGNSCKKEECCFYPFCDFAYNITKDSRWISKANNLCWINDRFINWGIRIINLNTVSELNYASPSLFKINEISLKNLAGVTDSYPES